MIAEVIPYTRTIRGKELFDYHIPSNLAVRKGMIVCVEFRNKQLPAIVWNIKQHSTFKIIKPILGFINENCLLDSFQLHFLGWFAFYYGISKPHAFKTIFSNINSSGFCCRREFPCNASLRHALQGSLPLRHHLPDLTIQVPFLKKKISLKEKEYLIHYSQYEDILNIYHSIATQQSGHLLIIVPEYHVVPKIVQALTLQNVIIITVPEKASPSFLAQTECTLQSSTQPVIIIGTKKCVFFHPKYFSAIILDQEESRSHKQYHCNPRYHVRNVLYNIRKLYTEKPFALILTSHAPSVESYARIAKNKTTYHDIRRPWKATHIEVIPMEQERQKQNYSWFSDKLIERIASSKCTLLFLNRTGNYGVAVCKDCFQLLPQDAAACTTCKSNRLRFARKGITRLEQEIHELFPKKRIVRIDKTTEKIHATTLQKADIVIATEKIFRVTPLSIFDYIGILSIDHLLVYPHFRSEERVFQLLVSLLSAQISILIQTFSPEHPIIQDAIHNRYQTFIQREMNIRKAFHLPPFGEYSYLINNRTKKNTPHKGAIDTSSLPQNLMIDRL
ncbi:MAG TPA: hypothetical protein VJB65_02340 [Patescibacteria group bacterium]|nr:hypothetical protein [Patescibacteria group bacterium]